MKSRFSYDVLNKDSKYGMSKHLTIDSFHIGQYIGIQLCDGFYDHSDRGQGCTYTAPEIFRVVETKKGNYNLLRLETVHELVVESVDNHIFSIFCTVTSGSTYALDKYKRYEWVLDERLVAWIENDLSTKRKGESTILTIYENATDVKSALERKEQYKQKIIEEKRRKAEAEQQAQQLKSKREVQERQAEKELDDLFGSGGKTHEIITCPRCGCKLRLPKKNVTLIYTCPKCGYKGEH